jgi:hypothetical protein
MDKQKIDEYCDIGIKVPVQPATTAFSIKAHEAAYNNLLLFASHIRLDTAGRRR